MTSLRSLLSFSKSVASSPLSGTGLEPCKVKVFPLPAGTLARFVSRGRWKDTAAFLGFLFLQSPQQQLKEPKRGAGCVLGVTLQLVLLAPWQAVSIACLPASVYWCCSGTCPVWQLEPTSSRQVGPRMTLHTSLSSSGLCSTLLNEVRISALGRGPPFPNCPLFEYSQSYGVVKFLLLLFICSG